MRRTGATLAQTQLEKQTAHVIAVIVHAKLALDHGRHAGRGPVVVGKAESDRLFTINLGYPGELLGREPAGTPRRLTALEGVHSFG